MTRSHVLPLTLSKLASFALVISVLLLAAPLMAIELQVPEKATQGELVLGRTHPEAAVRVASVRLPVSPRGYFALAVPRSQTTDMVVSAALGGITVSRTIRILAYPWRIQHIDGLANRYVNPDPKAQEKILKDNRMIREMRNSPSDSRPLFLARGFIKPVEGPRSSMFGSQRILNGQPKSPHSGVDYAAPRGTRIINPADGRVCLVAKGTYLMGNVLMIDHGLGVRSVFIHLDSIDVLEGDFIPRGSPVARVGQTGRATGPHLHWGVSVGSTLVNPENLIGRNLLAGL